MVFMPKEDVKAEDIGGGGIRKGIADKDTDIFEEILEEKSYKPY